MPIVAQTGTYVYASTLLRLGQIQIRTEKVGYQTRAAASWELLQKAPVHDTRMANYAAKLADQLIIPFPEQKAKIVRDLHRSGRTVAFVGDGLNDSVALAYADVSISFAQGSEVARETADVVLMNNNLTSVIEAIAIAKETKNLIDQNILLVVGPNLLALGLASTVGLNPLLATAIHNGTAITAGLNSLRPLAQHQIENYVK